MAFLLYKTDPWHTHDSKELLAICDTAESALSLAEMDAIQEGFPLKPEDLDQLVTMNQTQGYWGDGEYLIDEIESNVLI